MNWYVSILIASIVGMAAMQSVPVAAETGQRNVDIMRIAGSAPNRIVTPYKNPKIVTNFPHEAWSVGGVLYLLPGEDEGMIGGFIQDETGEFAVGVMFQIARIPPQEIRIDDPAFERVAPSGDGEDLTRGETESHVDSVVSTLIAALDSEEIPGFRQIQHRERDVYVGPFLKRLTSSQRRGRQQVDRYAVTHEGIEKRAINEASFSSPNRLGVLIYPPRSHLEPGDEVSVFILREVGNE